MSYGFIGDYCSYPATQTVMSCLLHLNSVCRQSLSVISRRATNFFVQAQHMRWEPFLRYACSSQFSLFVQLCAEQNSSFANFLWSTFTF